MTAGWFDSKVTVAVTVAVAVAVVVAVVVAVAVAVAVQAAAILFWTGAAAQRLQAAEDKLARQDLIAERLARIEAKLDDLSRRQERAEAR